MPITGIENGLMRWEKYSSISDQLAAFSQITYPELKNNRKSKLPKIENVIFNNPATIVIWADKTKTVVRCQDMDEFNKEHGLAMCMIKKLYDNKGNYNNVFEKWCK